MVYDGWMVDSIHTTVCGLSTSQLTGDIGITEYLIVFGTHFLFFFLHTR
jgi:hypothetical protein